MENQEEQNNIKNKPKRQAIKITSKAYKEESEKAKQESENNTKKELEKQSINDDKTAKSKNEQEENSGIPEIVMGKDRKLLERKKQESEKELEKLQSKSKLQKFFSLETLQKICLCLAYLSGALFVGISLMMILGILKIFPQDSPLFGFDLIPAIYIWYPFVFALICSLIAKKFKISIFFSIFMIIFIFCTADCSFCYKDKDASKQSAFGKTYKVATLNTAQYDKGFENISKSVNALSPDFIVLQEVNFPIELGAQVTKIAFPKYHIKYGKSDNIILSKYPIIEFHEIALPSKQPGYIDNTPENNKNNVPRYFQHAVVNDNGTKINILCLRLIAGRSKDFLKSPSECMEWGQYLARVQMKESAFMRQYIEKLKGPCVFGGDMNAPPYALSMKDIYAVGVDVALATKLIPDATFPAKGPNQRLDYIFCTRDFKPEKIEVQKDIISDHRCVLATLTLVEKEKYNVKTYKEYIEKGKKQKASKSDKKGKK